MKKVFVLSAVAACFTIIACNNAGDSKDPVEKADSTNKEMQDNDTTRGTVQTPDSKSSTFLVDAANGGMAEVKLSELALQKATTPSVKEFANMMVKDHTGANEKAKTLAAQKGIALPADVSEENKKKHDELAAKTGKDFEKDYVDLMVKDHEKTVSLFEKASGDVTDADVKMFVDNTLPTLKAHLEQIKTIQKNYK